MHLCGVDRRTEASHDPAGDQAGGFIGDVRGDLHHLGGIDDDTLGESADTQPGAHRLSFLVGQARRRIDRKSGHALRGDACLAAFAAPARAQERDQDAISHADVGGPHGGADVGHHSGHLMPEYRRKLPSPSAVHVDDVRVADRARQNPDADFALRGWVEPQGFNRQRLAELAAYRGLYLNRVRRHGYRDLQGLEVSAHRCRAHSARRGSKSRSYDDAPFPGPAHSPVRRRKAGSGSASYSAVSIVRRRFQSILVMLSAGFISFSRSSFDSRSGQQHGRHRRGVRGVRTPPTERFRMHGAPWPG